MSLSPWLARYNSAGLSPIPLKEGTKKPYRDAWQTTPVSEQWRGLGDCNIGLLATGQHVIIDCDSSQTVEAFERWAGGLGLDPKMIPHNSTASSNRHYHLRARAVRQSFNWGKLAIGRGELRARNAYTVAPCSTFEARAYTWLDGTMPEAILLQTPISWTDLLTLIPPVTPPQPVEGLPVPLLHRPIPYRTALLLRRLHQADKGQPVMGYASRSEGEAAVVATLILQGWDFGQIAQLFHQARPGHFAEHKKQTAYLGRTYQKMLGRVCDTPERAQLAAEYQRAALAPWPGRSGAQDRAVYLGLLAIAWQFSTVTPLAAQRDLQLWAGLSERQTVQRTMRNLIGAGLVRKVYRGDERFLTNCYLLTTPLHTALNTTTTVSYGNSIVLFGNSELWTPRALGRSAGLVYAHLNSTPQKALGLAGKSGKHRKTVERTIARLEAVGLAERVTGGWIRGNVSIETAERDFDCQKYAGLRLAKVQRDREDFQEVRMLYCEKRQGQPKERGVSYLPKRDIP